MTKQSELEPADPNQCQAERRDGATAFGFGPLGKLVRCKNKPIVIAREKKPAADGLIGEMSLCGPCKDAFEKQLGRDYATYTHLTEKAVNLK